MTNLSNFGLEKSPKKTREEIEGLLKKAADLIRTRVDYKYILLLLFLKRLSDQWKYEYKNYYEALLKKGLSEEEAKEEAKNKVYHDFDYPEGFFWDNIRKDVSKLPEKLSEVLKKIGELNPELRGVVDRLDFIEFTGNRENLEILRQLVELFGDMNLAVVSPDVLGDAYEWVLKYFAPQKAKEGEVYTPREVIKLLIEILDPKPLESVYDPASGSGGMLIQAYKHVEEQFGEEEVKKLFLYGQEVNQTTYALCEMNMIIHDIRDANIQVGDTLLYPKFKEGERLRQSDIVVANPPWNQDGYGEEVLKKAEFYKDRYKYGFAPNNSADWIWIQHMLASATDENGRVGIVIDNGVLFRGGKEKTIRSRILQNDLVECVILLSEKLFYNTGAPGAIIILNKNKTMDRKGKVLFINASNEYEQHPEVRKLNRLGEVHIKKIADVYREFKDSDGFSRVVSLNEIKENDNNLNVTPYVFPIGEVEKIDIAKEWEELGGIEEGIKNLDEKISDYFEELKYEK